ncbi:MAG TPA: hypothetical protein VD884_07645 [Ohtaekwangia sp.]|nr:hypothetical protein [Ohtaekwangia sp.]
MKQQPDNLFHKKLSTYSKPAPPLAWNKIEINLDKKKHNGIWLKLAASLLFIGATGALITLTLPDQPPTIAQVELTSPSVKAETESHAMPESISNDLSRESSAGSTVNEVNKMLDAEAPNETVTKIKTERTTTETITKRTEHAIPITTVAKAPSQPDDAEEKGVATIGQPSALSETLASPSENTQSITLVFSAAETTEYLDKKIIESDDATSAEKKTSTFQKLLRKATDLKTNQDPFGDLRQKKNEILALNFKSDKKRGQKNN